MCKRYLLVFFSIFLSGCGYQVGSRVKEVSSLSIPYVKGDDEGFLTSELVSSFASSGFFSYVHQGGEYELHVEVLSKKSEQLGYRHDRKEDGSAKKNITECEGRDLVKIQVSLQEKSSGKVVFGPSVFEGFVDYDYIDQNSKRDLAFVDSSGVPHTVLSFSLGQLEPISSAQEAATHPLYRDLAKKIVDSICSEW
ncbi:MAG: hypothetical protein WCP39_05835 [Chlamydiota bacterium]